MTKKIISLILLLNLGLAAANREEVRKKIEQYLRIVPSSTKVGILIYNPILRDTIFKMNHLTSMIPASNTKLFTTAAALANLGSDFKIYTKILTNDHDISDGIVNGNLYIKGYGNSTFTSQDLDQMVIEIKKKGIKAVTGNIVGDDTYFDNVYKRDDWIADEVANVKLPPISALTLDRNRKVTQKRRGRRIRTYVEPIKNPPLNAASVLRSKLVENGIKIEKKAITGVTPNHAVLLAESGIALREFIKNVNKHSDNFLAEGLFKTIGAETSKEQGNAFYSTQAILNFIEDNGIYAKGTAVVDGSGISRYDQVTPAAVVGLLEVMFFDIGNFDDFYNSLAVAGVDGTLRHRMIGTAAENNFRGKTGSLNGVTSLAGYLKTESSEDLIISIIFEYQKGSGDFFRSIADDIVSALCELSE